MPESSREKSLQLELNQFPRIDGRGVARRRARRAALQPELLPRLARLRAKPEIVKGRLQQVTKLNSSQFTQAYTCPSCSSTKSYKPIMQRRLRRAPRAIRAISP